MAKCRLKKVGPDRWKTTDGAASVAKFKRGLYSVMRKGQASFLVASLPAARRGACAKMR